jgi:hypothetical protein
MFPLNQLFLELFPLRARPILLFVPALLWGTLFIVGTVRLIAMHEWGYAVLAGLCALLFLAAALLGLLELLLIVPLRPRGHVRSARLAFDLESGSRPTRPTE